MSPSSFMDDDQREILQGFVEEGREMLDEVEPELIQFEQDSERGEESDSLDSIFRLFHSLKGGAGMLNLSHLQHVTHLAENLLTLYRKGETKPRREQIDLLNRCLDFLRSSLDSVEEQGNDEACAEDARNLGGQLEEVHKAISEGRVPNLSSVASADESEAGPVTEVEKTQDSSTEEEDDLDFQLMISDELVQQFMSESEELLSAAEESLLMLEHDNTNTTLVDTAFRSFHSFKGNCGIMGFSDMQTLSHQLESVLDNVRQGKLVVSSSMLSMILSCFDFLRKALAELSKLNPPAIPALQGLLTMLKDATASFDSEAQEPDNSTTLPSTPPPAAPEAPIELEMTLAPEVPEPAPVPAAPPASEPQVKQEAPKPEAPVEKKAPAKNEGDAKAASPERRKGEERRKGSRRGGLQSRQTIRVDVEKLDLLLNRVGELVIAETMVSQNPDLEGLDTSMERFDRSVRQLNKITRDLQDISTSIRMTTLSGLFRRMPRLVRDLSVRTGKKVELILEGEETEVDMTLIERITDPLVHIIRNSVDHGLETPEERSASGKDVTGRVTLSARVIGSEVWIVIEDDGRGLNRERILQKAQERDLIAGDGSDMSNDQVWQLIFEAGFSTAQEVSDVSGRGVGMDVVRKNIESIQGRVDLRSEPGSGSQVVLRIPLTLAITDGMIVRVGSSRYVIPIIHIRESMQPQSSQITHTMDGMEILRIRGELLPVMRLHKLFDIDEAIETIDEGIIIVLEYEGRHICLLVDEILGQQQIVVKGLSAYLGSMNGLSGCTILGNGEISLILDVNGLFDLSSKGKGVLNASNSRQLQQPSPSVRDEVTHECP